MVDSHDEPPSQARRASGRSRALAKEQVLQAWSQRRRESQSSLAGTESRQKNTNRTRSGPEYSKDGRNELHPLCKVIQTKWLDLWGTLLSDRKPRHVLPSIRRLDATVTFPSVVSIQQAHELVKQVESIQHPEPGDRLDDKDNAGINSGISVVSSGLNWNQAILGMAQTRSRAFLMIDLTSIIRTTVDWRRRLRSLGGRLRFLYSLTANPDPRLFKVLSQTGMIHPVTSTKWDIRRLVSSSSLLGNTCVYDSTAFSNKPDGYLREWIRLHQNRQNPQFVARDESSNMKQGYCVLAVDGASEVERIFQFQKRLQTRLTTQPMSPDASDACLAFMIRLEGHVESDWRKTIFAISSLLDGTDCMIVGVSVDLSPNETLVKRCLDFVLEALFVTKKTANIATSFRLDFRGIPSYPFRETEDIGYWSELLAKPYISEVTVDATKALLTSTGALCTRIIGVREQQKTESKDLTRHYYVDDGCYGSLYQLKEHERKPLPLVSRAEAEMNHFNGTSSTGSASDSGDEVDSTVWGPTCDGLDKVCHGMQLPKLKRDDWLVFPGIGAVSNEGMGTAFNGFDPPDTVYCVRDFFK